MSTLRPPRSTMYSRHGGPNWNTGSTFSSSSKFPLARDLLARSYEPSSDSLSNLLTPNPRGEIRRRRYSPDPGMNDNDWKNLLQRRTEQKKRKKRIGPRTAIGYNDNDCKDLRTINDYLDQVVAKSKLGLMDEGRDSISSPSQLYPKKAIASTFGSFVAKSRKHLSKVKTAQEVTPSKVVDVKLKPTKDAFVKENARPVAPSCDNDAPNSTSTAEETTTRSSFALGTMTSRKQPIQPKILLQQPHESEKFDTLDTYGLISTSMNGRSCPKSINLEILIGQGTADQLGECARDLSVVPTKSLLLQNHFVRLEPAHLESGNVLDPTLQHLKASRASMVSSSTLPTQQGVAPKMTLSEVGSNLDQVSYDRASDCCGSSNDMGQPQPKVNSNQDLNQRVNDIHYKEASSDNEDEDEDDWEYYSDDDEEELTNSLSPSTANKAYNKPRLSGMSMALLNMFDNTWNYWEEEEDNEEEEEVDEKSPYYQIPVPEPGVSPWIADEIRDWIKEFQDKKTFKKLNKVLLEKSDTKKGAKLDEESDNSNTLSEVFKIKGKKHGLFRSLDHANGNCLKTFGAHLNDQIAGAMWERLPGNAYLVKFLNGNNNGEETTGTYLYPDLIHAIHGTFSNGKLLQGKYGFVKSVTYEHEILRPHIRILSDQDTFQFDQSTSIRISSTPLFRDPYEHHMVYVDHSGIPYAGEGLYAKQSIEPGTLISIFNGIRIRDFNSTETRFREGFTDYKILLKRDMSLDIPKDSQRTAKYCATLGHKCCHSFSPNADFRELYHPRFGHVMSLVAIDYIRPKTEILVSYNYHIDKSPEWYRDLYFQHLRKVEGKSEEHLLSLSRKISRNSGVNIKIPSPARTSDRFVPCGNCNEHVGLDNFSAACESCSTWFHVACLTREQQDIIQTATARESLDAFIWKCAKCR
ncbi:uncharacterized protein LOC131884188 [Tigriopus californicus]|uniref:uncharacterized protein LOC131884188 n=1 Tax=Tigriopus californicus TaxID=6832 RepID=UPI0027DA0DEC|nr:uncharacterized protein LOC131884188 [Tigriopus californicus]